MKFFERSMPSCTHLCRLPVTSLYRRITGLFSGATAGSLISCEMFSMPICCFFSSQAMLISLASFCSADWFAAKFALPFISVSPSTVFLIHSGIAPRTRESLYFSMVSLSSFRMEFMIPPAISFLSIIWATTFLWLTFFLSQSKTTVELSWLAFEPGASPCKEASLCSSASSSPREASQALAPVQANAPNTRSDDARGMLRRNSAD
mmetsp:Transcript_102085/g.271676  ORF Transcript_102085/g.271676 Transcript_102085/m.271676 type:complete len:206 (-) Transcript_102085:32-649(-)